MSSFETARRRVLAVSMLLSILLHGVTLLLFEVLSPGEETRTYRVMFRPAGPIRARRFLVIGTGRARPEVAMERLIRRAEPLAVPKIPSVPGLAPVRVEVMIPEPPDVDERLAAAVGAKPPEFSLPHPEMIPTEELGVPKRPRFDLTLDLLRLEDLEKTGLKSFVIVDREERRNIVGYFHVTRIGGMEGEGTDLTRLANNVSRRTGLRVKADDHSVRLRSPEILEAPLLFLGRPGPFEYDESGMKREPLGVGVDTLEVIEGVEKQDIEFLTEYLLKGGFLVLPNIELYNQLKRYLQEAHPERFTFFDLPDDHELFYSYYDIPPQPLYDLFRSINLRRPALFRDFPSVFKGIGLEGRLVGFAPMWVPRLDTGADSLLYTPLTRLSTNLITYALTQPGGIGYTLFKEPEPERSYEGEPDAYLAILRSPNTETLDLVRTKVFLNDEQVYGGEESNEFFATEDFSRGAGEQGSRGEPPGPPAPFAFRGSARDGGSEYDGMLFHPLTGGKRTVRIEYEGKAVEVSLVLRGDRVTTLTVGSTRFLWMTRLWTKVTGEDESYPAWQSRTAHLRIRLASTASESIW